MSDPFVGCEKISLDNSTDETKVITALMCTSNKNLACHFPVNGNVRLAQCLASAGNKGLRLLLALYLWRNKVSCVNWDYW